MTDEELQRIVAGRDGPSCDYGGGCEPEDAADLAEELLACREVLRAVEWIDEEDMPSYCPSCGGWTLVGRDGKPQPQGYVTVPGRGPGHAPGCKLKARIP